MADRLGQATAAVQRPQLRSQLDGVRKSLNYLDGLIPRLASAVDRLRGQRPRDVKPGTDSSPGRTETSLSEDIAGLSAFTEALGSQLNSEIEALEQLV